MEKKVKKNERVKVFVRVPSRLIQQDKAKLHKTDNRNTTVVIVRG